MADRVISYDFRARFDGFKSQVTAAGRSVDDFGKKLLEIDRRGEQMRRGLVGLGDTAGKVGLVAAGGLAAATKAAIDWESAWAGVVKTTDGTASQMAALEGELRELARTMPATHQEIAATAEAAGQLGVAREDVADFTKTMIQLGETTDLTADAAATAVAQIANVMGTAPDDIDRMGAALVALGNDGASTESQILSMAQRISGAGAQIGLTEPEILAISNAVASVGIEAEAGGSAVSTAFTKMAMAVSSGGPKLEKFAEIAGTSTTEFQRLFKEAPAEAFAAFTQGLDRINKSGGDVFGTLKEVGLSDIRVSQAMLSMAGAGDLLTKSLTLGNKAWSENSALAEEFAKRAGTTASEVQVAWNNVKDAGIELGATMLPILSSAASTVTTLTDAFQSLPGPIKTGTAAAAGITAVFGGGLWFTAKTVSGIANMRQNLADLGVSAGGARTRLLALNGVKFVGLAAALTAVEQGMEKAFNTRIDAVDLERNLEALADGRISDDLKNLGDDIANLTSRTNRVAEPIRELAQGIFTLGQSTDTPLDKSAANIEQLDQALANMVEGGDIEKARSTFADLLEVIRQGGGSQVDAIPMFDAFGTALKNVKDSAEEAAPPIVDSTGAVIDMGNAAAGAVPLTEEMAEALKDGRDAAYESASSFVNLGDSLNDSKVSLGGWIAELEKNAQALRDFTKNSRQAAKKGLDEGLVQSLQDAGEEGALRMQQLAGASEAEIKRANKAWRGGQRATNEYANSVEDLLRKLLDLPPRTSTDVQVNDSKATSSINAVESRLGELVRPRTIPLSADVNLTGAWAKLKGFFAAASAGPKMQGPVKPAGSAEGSTVPHGGPYEDRYPYLLAPGEEVISNRFGQADRNRPLLKAINAGLLADGGTAWRDGIPALASGGTGKRGKARKNADLGAFIDVYGIGDRSLKGFIKSLEESKSALEAESEARVSLAAELGNTVAEMFTSSLGRSSSDVWSRGGSWADIFGTLGADTAGAGAYSANVSKLQALGLDDPGALNALLSQNDAASIANLAATGSAALVAQYEQQYQIRAQAVGALNTQVVAAQTAALSAAQAVTNAELTKVNAQLAQLNGIQKGAPAATGKATAKASNKGASKASQSIRRG